MIQQGFCCVFDYIYKIIVDINKNINTGLKTAKCNEILDTIIDKYYDLTLNNYNQLSLSGL